MPFFQLASKLVYFAHVPKCGGTSVERGLMDNGLKMAFPRRPMVGSGRK